MRCTRRLLPVLLAVALAGPLVGVPATGQQVTQYQTRLQGHLDVFAQTKAEIARLRGAPSPASPSETEKRKGEIRAVGSRLLTEGRAFETTVKEFLAGETRRGLDVEIQAVRTGAATVNEQTLEYRQLVGAKIAKRTAADAPAVASQAQQLAAELVAARFDDVLVANGLRDVLNATSWQEVRRKTQATARQVLNRTIDGATKKLVGLAFHDRRSMQRAVTLSVNDEISRSVTRLLVNLGADQLVISLAGSVLVKWVADAFWTHVLPAVKELFRGKDNLDARVTTSIGTLNEARNALNQLPGEARRTDVIAALNGALRTLTATNYLQRDLKKARRSDLLVNLGGAIEDLSRTYRITWSRFLLDKEDAVQALTADRRVLTDALAELAELVGKSPSCIASPNDYEVTVSERTVELGLANKNLKMYTWWVTYKNKGSETLYVTVLESSELHNGQPTWRGWNAASPEIPDSRLVPGASGTRRGLFTQYPDATGYHYVWSYDEKVLFLYDRPGCYLTPESVEDQAVSVPNPIPSMPS